MRKRSAFIGLLISLMPISQTLIMKYGILITSSVFALPLKVYAESPSDLYKKGLKKVKEIKDYEGAIEDFTKAIELGENDSVIYYLRGMSRRLTEDSKGACKDWKKAAELGDKDSEELLKKYCS